MGNIIVGLGLCQAHVACTYGMRDLMVSVLVCSVMLPVDIWVTSRDKIAWQLVMLFRWPLPAIAT